MYALALSQVLEKPAESRVAGRMLTIDSRGACISQLLKTRGLSADLQSQFNAIDDELHGVLKHQIIGARHAAVIGTLRQRPKVSESQANVPKGWFETGKDSSYEELLCYIGDMEKDIVTVVSLYLQIATLALRVEDALALH